ncbi:hypothetical protein Afil01_26220 [Actinorhabdospora filicis]|uniref:Uncharacterized protein n=1 Tax=Actinorhabdospora filicis TaxID=1785913 RepID=A0A9W6SIQ5_9ACTN|nr:hypothetical protein [Actinorhabdospora filicis]GLZ77815.1 hypothetical protein Afil01_26220 [Actinorhabdospora filicis]
MSDEKAFAADLQYLWRAGTVSLPLVADAYAGATGTLWEVGREGQDAITSRMSDTSVPGGTPEQSHFAISRRVADAKTLQRVYQPFEDVRRVLHQAIAGTAQNLYDAAAILRGLTEHYKATDANAARELDAYIVEQISDPDFTYPAWPQVPISGPDKPYPPKDQ